MPLTVLEATRHEWQEGHRRLEAAAGDRAATSGACSGRSSSSSTSCAAGSARPSRWTSSQPRTRSPTAGSQEALAEREPAPGWPARLTTVQDAAFHIYSRGAVDYRP